MGGRLDAVNLFDADISLITSISRDHQDFLGNTLKEILSEKWGITRAGKVCFSALESNYLRYLLSGWAKEKGVLWSDLFDLHLLQKTDAFPVRNLEIAKKCMETLFPERKDVIERNTPALRSKIFKGRGELLSFNQRQFIFYGSHNLDGVRKLLHLLRSDCYTFKAGEKYCFLISLSARRREEMLGMLSAFVCFSKSSRVKAIYVTNFTHHKAATADVLKEVIAEVHLKHQGKIQFVEDWKKIVLEDHVGKYLVTGSYYFVGKVQEDLDHLLFPSSSL
jgi:dihydrofolate synthase/folylpolyglutamate synthase